MTPTPEMIAMAERIASEQDWDINPAEACRKAVLAAIMEVSEKAADYLQGLAVKRSDHLKVAAISNGEHLR